jgi:hypothetical protein
LHFHFSATASQQLLRRDRLLMIFAAPAREEATVVLRVRAGEKRPLPARPVG